MERDATWADRDRFDGAFARTYFRRFGPGVVSSIGVGTDVRHGRTAPGAKTEGSASGSAEPPASTSEHRKRVGQGESAWRSWATPQD